MRPDKCLRKRQHRARNYDRMTKFSETLFDERECFTQKIQKSVTLAKLESFLCLKDNHFATIFFHKYVGTKTLNKREIISLLYDKFPLFLEKENTKHELQSSHWDSRLFNFCERVLEKVPHHSFPEKLFAFFKNRRLDNLRFGEDFYFTFFFYKLSRKAPQKEAKAMASSCYSKLCERYATKDMMKIPVEIAHDDEFMTGIEVYRVVSSFEDGDFEYPPSPEMFTSFIKYQEVTVGYSKYFFGLSSPLPLLKCFIKDGVWSHFSFRDMYNIFLSVEKLDVPLTGCSEIGRFYDSYFELSEIFSILKMIIEGGTSSLVQIVGLSLFYSTVSSFQN